MSDNPHMNREPHPTLPAASARQGLRGRHILIVLLISTVLAAAGMFAAWGWKAPGLAKPGSQQSVQPTSTAEVFHAPEPTPIVPQPGQDHTAPSSR
jgi:hypothetical protein